MTYNGPHVDLPMTYLNGMVLRCEKARQRYQAANPDLPIKDLVVHGNIDGEGKPWWLVGLYGDSKYQAIGDTLDQALSMWLGDYEHYWD